MANRVIRDWTDSENVHKLSAEAERFYTRLIMKADDFGRYVGNVKLLNSTLFPLHDSITVKDVEGWLSECVIAGILHRYSVDGKPYLEIKGFDQKGLRVRRSKYPPSSEAERYELITGYVYVIGVSFDKPVKIGFSMNPWSRLKEITANHPENLEVLLSFKAEKRIESLLHLECKHLRVKNEWFQLTQTEIDVLKAVADEILPVTSLIDTLRSNYEQLRNTTNLETETETEVETETEIETEGTREESRLCVWPTFNDFWEKYDKKIDRPKCERKWNKLTQGAREKIMQHLEEYIPGTPDKQYRKHPSTYLNNASWENEVIINGKATTTQPADKNREHAASLVAALQRDRAKLFEGGTV